MSTESKRYLVSFFDPGFEPVSVDHGDYLSEALDAKNSPLLFGCRTGICGTCVIEVEGDLPAAGPEEQEILDLYAPDTPNARLACQIELTGPIRVGPLNFD